MSTHKHINKICIVVMVITLLLTLVFMNGEKFGIEVASKTIGYEERLFDTTKVHTIDIVMDDWDSFIETCENEEYAVCAVVLDGESYKNVGIRAKGNTSLSTVSSMDSDRYSFKIEFDQYDNTNTYYGLDKLSLNNIIQDTTYMKDYLTYQMMGAFGVDAPLCSYVNITVNGEDWGLYLAVEGVEDSFLQRNYGNDYGELYKPDSMSFGGGRGNGMDFNMDDIMKSMPEGFDPSIMPGGGNNSGRTEGFGKSGMGSSDVKLQYIDDDPNSYSNIFSNAKTDITKADETRLIESLKALSSGENIEDVVDVEKVIRYLVVHNFVCNGDSYTGTMIHNYYLYEEDGQLSMIPWDYNLAYGTFQSLDATSTVNSPIDSPVSGGTTDDRPMISWIFSNEEYTELYHQYFSEFLESVDITELIDNAQELIAPYVEKDPTKFYTYEEFETGVATLKEFCQLRKESIEGQLTGIIPTTTSGQSEDSSALIDASHITISNMGSMGGGKGGKTTNGMEFPGGGFNRGQQQNFNDVNGEANSNQQIPEGMEPPKTTEMPEGMELPERTKAPEGFDGQFKESMKDFPRGTQDNSSASQDTNVMLLFGVSILVLMVGLLVAFKFKR